MAGMAAMADPTPSARRRLRAGRRGQSRPGQRLDRQFRVQPETLTVSAGQSVTFTNNDSVAHTTTSSAWDSGDIQPGAASRSPHRQHRGRTPFIVRYIHS